MPISRRLRSSCPAAAAIGVALVAAGCGGGQARHHHKQVAVVTTPTVTTTKPAPPPPPLVASARDVQSKATGSAVAVKPGDSVLLRFVIHPPPGAAGKTLKLSLPTGTGKVLKVSGKALGHRASVSLHSASGAPVELQRVSYTCELPPATVTCPSNNMRTVGTNAVIKLVAAQTTSIVAYAVVGPTTAIKEIPEPPVGQAIVPPYRAVELVKAAAAKAKPSRQKATATATASPGDAVTMITVTTGSRGGAMQPVTITVLQGPAKSLTISASTKGGTSIPATITSATGKPIELVLPHFTCIAPLFPTFGPATGTTVTHGRYEITFMTAPGRSPIILSGTVQAG
jgi:hypothetical protein